ncbi:alanine:cation symporter family protein, partial [Pseudomonas aeruginosa]|nr:alanine:cation symporter family protein [Pseudomonas aeruginosa]
NAIVEATNNAWHWNAQYVGWVLVAITAFIIFGGVKRIGSVSAKLVPMMALFYLIIAVIILGMNIHAIPMVISRIVSSAFD